MEASANAIEDVFFKAVNTVDIPTQDILSWIFDVPRYPQDQAVSLWILNRSFPLRVCRFMSIPKTPPIRWMYDRQEISLAASLLALGQLR